MIPSEIDIRTAKQVRNRLESKVKILDFRLYGSRARGDSSPDSDMDLFIEVEESDKYTKDFIAEIAWEIGIERLIHISPLIFTRQECEETPLRSSPILRNIYKEGIRV